MKVREYEAIARREDGHFWHVARREILADALRRHLPATDGLDILDAGCGPGGNSLFLKDFGAVTGLDASQTALELAKRREYRDLVQADAAHSPFADGRFDLIASLDMLEHVGDDRLVLREFNRVLKTGGHVLLTVPAHQWLWSRHDRVLGHYRRYSLNNLQGLLTEAGFETVRGTHFIVPSVPATFLRKTVDAFTGADAEDATYDFDPSPRANAALLGLLRAERAWLSAASLPIGTSLLVLAQKK